MRERDGDVEVLATYFLREIGRELQRELHGFAPAAMAAMLAYPWPGNVRELIATIRRAVVLANGPLIEAADLRLEPVRLPAPARPKPLARDGRAEVFPRGRRAAAAPSATRSCRRSRRAAST